LPPAPPPGSTEEEEPHRSVEVKQEQCRAGHTATITAAAAAAATATTTATTATATATATIGTIDLVADERVDDVDDDGDARWDEKVRVLPEPPRVFDHPRKASRIPAQCPVSLKAMLEPVRNEACSHIYSREGILLLLNSRPQCPCPIGGCRSMVSVDSLRTDAEHLPTHSAYVDIEDDEGEHEDGDDVDEEGDVVLISSNTRLDRPRARSAPAGFNMQHIYPLPVEMQLLLEQEERARQTSVANLPPPPPPPSGDVASIY
jgi:hypothetical protein